MWAQGEELAYLVPSTLDYEEFMMANGKIDPADQYKLQNPYSGFDGPEPYTLVGAQVADTIYVNLRIINATKRNKLPEKAVDDAMTDLTAAFSNLPRNGYGVSAIRFCYSELKSEE